MAETFPDLDKPPMCDDCGVPNPAVYHPSAGWLWLCFNSECSAYGLFHNGDPDTPSLTMEEVASGGYPRSGMDGSLHHHN